MIKWPLAVCVFPEPDLNRPRSVQYPNYLHEILQHAGVCYTTFNVDELPNRLAETQMLVTIGERTLSDDAKHKLREFVNNGGGWLSIGGICGLEDVLGTAQAEAYKGFGAGARTLGEGYLTPSPGLSRAEPRDTPGEGRGEGRLTSDHPALAHLEKPLHFFNGLAMQSKGAKVLATALDKHGRAKNEPVLFEHSFGNGKTITTAIDITGTIVLVQQGFAVTRDGIPAPDGTAPVSDGVLKSGDGGVLDWIFDRDEIKPGFNAYLRPVADLWRELLLRSIFHLARELNVSLPLLWHWPRNLPAIAHMSHDTDGNVPANGWKLLDLLKQADIRTTWCVILPGYEKPIMDAIRAAGHEFATHYDAMTEGLDFCREQFDRQFRELKQLFGEQPVSNKNHYLRWEGDMEFFDWCAANGIQLDQSKGASKTGEAGFNFGTCHAYFPVRFNGQFVDVLEMATTTQDLGVFAEEILLEPLLDRAIKHYGILHLLFHPAHVLKDYVERPLLRAAKLAKERGLEWWTARQINDWERARRKIAWNVDGDGIALSAKTDLEDATILRLSPRSSNNTIERWGFKFDAQTKTVGSFQNLRI